jgi:hypothetical protein
MEAKQLLSLPKGLEVTNIDETDGVLTISGLMLSASICYKHSFSLPDVPEICYVLREKASNSVSYRKVLPNEDCSSL